MGNHRFRLSDMIPNAWFYKLKGMGRLRNQNNTTTTTRKKHHQHHKTSPNSNQPHLLSHQRKSYYFTRDLTDHPPPPPNPSFETTLPNHNSPTKKNPKSSDTQLPRKSTRKKPSSKKTKNRPPPKIVTSSSVTAGCSCRTSSVESVWTKPESPTSLSTSSDSESFVPEFGLENKPFDGKFDSSFDLGLPPIITKKTPNRFTEAINDLKKKEAKNQKTGPVLRTSSPPVSCSQGGVRLRTNSPKIARRRIQGIARRSASTPPRRSLSGTFAVVKSSSDPQRDFGESMVEMILENNIRASKDLEDLLACYLSLNSYEYHELIIKAFKKIWFELK